MSVSPVPGLEGVAGPLEQVSFHDHAIRSVNVELHLSVIVGEVLRDTHTHFSLERRTRFTEYCIMVQTMSHPQTH